MVGRERELEVGGRWLASLEHDSGCLILEGEAGIGKTTLWGELVAQGAASGFRLLSCAPAEAETSLSFAALADLMSEIDRGVSAGLPAPQRRALEVALLEAEPGAQPLERRAVFAGFCSVLLRLADESAVLVAVDDLQWLDQPSQAALEFALRRLGRHPVGFLGSLRVGDSPRLKAGLARAFQERGAERVVLSPLSVGVLHELVVAKLGHNLARPLMVRIAAAARGNPFYAVEISREVVRRGTPARVGTLPVPDDLSDLVAARVRRLPHATRKALLVMAALSTPRLELVDRTALGPAEEAGLIELGAEQAWFSHPLFAAAVYGSASMPERRELHRRLAALVVDPEERARHLALGAEKASEDIALELEHAAERSVSRGAPDAAAELLELAIRLAPSASERSPLRALRAAECHFHAGDRTRAMSLAEQVLADSPQGQVRGRALQLLGEVRYHEDSFREAVPLFEAALEVLRDDPRAAELHVNLAFAHWSLGELAPAAAHGQAALEAVERLGGSRLAAVALAMSAFIEFELDRPLDRARMASALALEDPDQQVAMLMRPSYIAGTADFFADRFERARTLFAEVRQRVLDRGEESSLPHLGVNMSVLERSCGNLQLALEFAENSHEIARTLGSKNAEALALAERCFVRSSLGEVDLARADGEQVLAIEQRASVGYAAGVVRAALAFLELSIGNAQRASELLEFLAAAVESVGHCNPSSATFGLPDKIEALISTGELERAEALTAMLERHGQVHDRGSVLARAARCRALLAAARGDPTAAQVEIDEALAHHARVPMPLELGRTLVVKGQVERRGKQKRAARESFERAQERFDSIGARSWSEHVRTELERTGVRHTEGDALTPTELRVAELAAAGLTNKRIAETVFISAKTVEANLTHIYLKLGIHSRAELGRAMAERSVGSSASK
jgi:DNA-binding CsgD family transcriptional regulator